MPCAVPVFPSSWHYYTIMRPLQTSFVPAVRHLMRQPRRCGVSPRREGRVALVAPDAQGVRRSATDQVKRLDCDSYLTSTLFRRGATEPPNQRYPSPSVALHKELPLYLQRHLTLLSFTAYSTKSRRTPCRKRSDKSVNHLPRLRTRRAKAWRGSARGAASGRAVGRGTCPSPNTFV